MERNKQVRYTREREKLALSGRRSCMVLVRPETML